MRMASNARGGLAQRARIRLSQRVSSSIKSRVDYRTLTKERLRAGGAGRCEVRAYQ